MSALRLIFQLVGLITQTRKLLLLLLFVVILRTYRGASEVIIRGEISTLIGSFHRC